MSSSPVRHRQSDSSAAQPAFSSSVRSTSPYYQLSRQSAIGQGNSGSSPSKSFLNPSSNSFQTSRKSEPSLFGGFQNYRSDDDNRRIQMNSIVFGTSNTTPATQSYPSTPADDDGIEIFDQVSGFGSKNASQPPSRNGIEFGSNHNVRSQGAPLFSHPSSASLASHRPSHSSRQSFHSENRGFDDLHSDAISALGKMNLHNGDNAIYQQNAPQRQDFVASVAYDPTSTRQRLSSGGIPITQPTFGSFTPDILPDNALVQQYNTYRNARQGSSSPGGSEYKRGVHSPYYANGSTPPVANDHYRGPSSVSSRSSSHGGQAAYLDRRLRLVQQQQESYGNPQMNGLQPRMPYTPNIDYSNYATQAAMRMNQLNPYAGYYTPDQIQMLSGGPIVPRGPARDQDVGQNVRSALLEEFRTNSKNKRYELKV